MLGSTSAERPGHPDHADDQTFGVVAALSRDLHRVLRLLADDHVVRAHADGRQRLPSARDDSRPTQLRRSACCSRPYPLGQFLGSPVIGALSDRFGRKPVLCISLLIAVAAYAVVSLGIEWRSLALLASGCLIGGLAESNIAIAQSAISDVTEPEQRPRYFAWIYSCCSLGYIAGPLIGGHMAATLGWSAPFWAVIPLLALTLVWILVSFRETHEAQPRPPLQRVLGPDKSRHRVHGQADPQILSDQLHHLPRPVRLFPHGARLHGRSLGNDRASDDDDLFRPGSDLRRRKLRTDDAAVEIFRSEAAGDRRRSARRSGHDFGHHSSPSWARSG